MKTLLIHCDVEITRRNRLQHVFDADDILLYSSKSLAACLDWCVDTGAMRAVIVTEAQIIVLELQARYSLKQLAEEHRATTAALLAWLAAK